MIMPIGFSTFMQPDPPLPLPARYQFKALLGQGGAGEVLSAWDTQLKRTVAVKRLRQATMPDADVRDAWQEAMCLASIRHPNIVSVFDIGTEHDAPYMVMEFVQGETLEQAVRRSPLEIPVFCDIAAQCLEGIAAAHHSGLVHRDLKPANIMLVRLPTGQFQVKLLDFGIAQYLQENQVEGDTNAVAVTGTIHWISPEQLEGAAVDGQSDLYSLGCVFYFCLTGVPPFSGTTPNEILQAHLAGDACPLAVLRPDVPPALAGWVMSLMARRPDDRPAGAIDALRRLEPPAANFVKTTRISAPLSGPPPGVDEETGRIDCRMLDSPAAPPPEPRKPVWPLAAATALFVAVVGLLGWMFFQKPEQPVFRIHGSNTIGSTLAPALVEGFLTQRGNKEIQTESAHGSVERRVGFLDSRSGRREFVEVHAHGSRTAFSGLRDGLCDIGMSSSRARESDVSELAGKGIGNMRTPSCEIIAALDGLAVLVHPENPLSQLDRRAVAAIFEGKTTDWAEVGRERPGKINLHARDSNSGTFEFFQSVVLGNGSLAPDALRYQDSTELSRAVLADEDAIGFVALPYILDCKALAIGDDGTPALIPSRFTVATEDYALSRRLFFYVPASGMHPWARKFLEFATGPAGQDIVSRVGFVKQTPVVQPGLVPRNAPAEYQSLLENAERVSLNVRFSADTGALDSKAALDLGRLVDLMAVPENRGRELALAGFHEDTGDAAADLASSVQSASLVAAEIEKRGLKVRHVTGYGAALPVGSNNDPAGRWKNRRVEIWIRGPRDPLAFSPQGN